jgi:hypothetical protein
MLTKLLNTWLDSIIIVYIPLQILHQVKFLMIFYWIMMVKF